MLSRRLALAGNTNPSYPHPERVPLFNENGNLVPTSCRWGHRQERARLRPGVLSQSDVLNQEPRLSVTEGGGLRDNPALCSSGVRSSMDDDRSSSPSPIGRGSPRWSVVSAPYF